jgi:hypothetical protein
MRRLEKSGLSEPLIDCSPEEGILQITIFALVGAPSRGGTARLVVLDREPEQYGHVCRPALGDAGAGHPTRHRNVDVVFRFAADSLLEGDGFEPSVPRVMTAI